MGLFHKKSVLLLWVGGLILLISISGGIFTLYMNRSISGDAQKINQLGGIRGSIQRLVKLELAGSANDPLLIKIDEEIQTIRSLKKSIFEDNQTFSLEVDRLTSSWEQLKISLERYRLDSGSENEKRLTIISEEVWDNANSMVLASQLLSERKVKNYKISLIFTGLNLLLGIAILFLVQKYVKKKLEHGMDHDGLTDLYNRRYFDVFLKHQIQRADRYGRLFSLILFDIDHFKKINDSFGHDVGDSVLQELSEMVKLNIRKSDVLARVGGEEFAIVVIETPLEEACKLAEKVRALIEKHSFHQAGTVTVSLGVSQYSPGDEAKTLYKRADLALYRAKHEGRNRIEFHDLQFT